MDFNLNQYRLSDMKVQRNALAGICVALLGMNGVQSLYLFFRHERTIIMPPQLNQGVWVEGNRFSPQYLEEMALHYAHFFLDVTAQSILYQGDILLRYVTPEAYGTFKAKLLEDEKRLKKDNLSTRFCPSETSVSPDALTVDITGDLMGYVGDKRISQARETYRLKFRTQSGRLLIAAFSLLTPKNANKEMEP